MENISWFLIFAVQDLPRNTVKIRRRENFPFYAIIKGNYLCKQSIALANNVFMLIHAQTSLNLLFIIIIIMDTNTASRIIDMLNEFRIMPTNMMLQMMQA